jgi:hypothetical protein
MAEATLYVRGGRCDGWSRSAGGCGGYWAGTLRSPLVHVRSFLLHGWAPSATMCPKISSVDGLPQGDIHCPALPLQMMRRHTRMLLTLFEGMHHHGGGSVELGEIPQVCLARPDSGAMWRRYMFGCTVLELTRERTQRRGDVGPPRV